MRIFKSLGSLLGLLLGGVGMLAFLAVLIVGWNLSSQARQSTDHVFDQVHQGLSQFQHTMQETKQKLREAQSKTDQLKDVLNQWKTSTQDNRLALRTKFRQQSKMLNQSVEQVDHWLQTTQSAISLASQALLLANNAGLPIDQESTDELREQLALVIQKMAGTQEKIDQINQFFAQENPQSLTQADRQAIAQRVLALLTQLGTLTDQFDTLESKVKNVEQRLEQWRANTQRILFYVTLGAGVLTLWLLVSQWALFCISWKSLTTKPEHEPVGN